MACERNRTLQLTDYAKNLGIEVNIGKNNARGNKGFFKASSNNYRIDISKNVSDSDKIGILVHELVHYIHYTYDKTLKSIDFIFDGNYEIFEEDLLKLTVEAVPKEFAADLFSKKKELKNCISDITNNIKKYYPEIKLSEKNNKLEKEISKSEYKYLLKYDRVKVLSGFKTKIYSLNTLNTDFPSIKSGHADYIKLCSLKRKLNNVNRRISRLNKYYNNPSELLARSLECYALKPEYMKLNTPKLYSYYNNLINSKRIDKLSEIMEIIKSED